MAHKAQEDKEIIINTDNVPENYAAKLCFTVKGNHLVDICVTENHLDKLAKTIQEFKQQQAA